MSIWERDYVQQADQGAISAFTSRVYGWMTIGLLMTAIIAFGVIHSGLYMTLLPYTFLISIGTLVLAIAMSRGMARASFKTLAGMFLGYSGLQGVFFGTVIPMYAMAYGGSTIYMAFLTAGIIFLTAMIYGKVTKTDLTRFAAIFRMALFGLIGVTVVYAIMSFFVSLPGMLLLISYLGLVIFVALTAYDAQTIKRMATQVQGDGVIARKMSLMMALKMYLNVIMIFWYLLQIFSSNRR